MAICTNCNQTFEHNYCNHCGQKKFNPNNKSIKHVATEFLELFTHFDSKVFKSVFYILVKPGEITYAYLNGKRKKYLNPIQVFLLAIIAFLVFQPKTTNIYYRSLNEYERAFQWPYVLTSIKEKTVAYNGNRALLNEVFNHKMTYVSKFYIVVNVFIIAVVMFILFYRKSRFFIDHLFLSVEYFIYYLVFVKAISTPIIFDWFLRKVLHIRPITDAISQPIDICLIFYFLPLIEYINVIKYTLLPQPFY